MAHIIIIGCGSIGHNLGKNLIQHGHRVTGIKKNPIKNHGGIHYIYCDIGLKSELSKIDFSSEAIVFMVPPAERRELAYRLLYDTSLSQWLNLLNKQNVSSPIIFVSSTAVYGQNQGEWVDELSETKPQHFRGQWLRHGEKQILNHGKINSVLRLSGIYGPGRQRLLNLARSNTPIASHPPYYTNRIHSEDVVGLLQWMIERKLKNSPVPHLLLGSDLDPAPLHEVVGFLRKQWGLSPLPDQSHDKGQNKRCRSSLLKDLGFQFRYPDYKEGYRELVF